MVSPTRIAPLTEIEKVISAVAGWNVSGSTSAPRTPRAVTSRARRGLFGGATHAPLVEHGVERDEKIEVDASDVGHLHKRNQ